MARLSLTQTPSLQLNHQHRLLHRLKLANLLGLPEQSFSELVQRVETDPLFRNYKNASEKKYQIFRYKRYPKTGISSGFLGLNENILSSDTPSQIDGLVDNKQEIVKLCQNIGLEKFRTLFLYNDGNLTIDQIAGECGLSKEDTQKIMDLVDKVALEEEFRPTTNKTSASTHEHYSKIASINEEQAQGFVVNYTSLRYGRGRYDIDYQKFQALKKDPYSSKEEIRYLQSLIKTIELINARKSTIYQTIEKITERQRSFLLTKEPGKLNSMTQLELARELDIHSSSISRAIFGKSIEMPWGEEIPLKFFFVKGPVNKIKAAIYLLIENEEKLVQEGKMTLPYRDEEIKNLLKVEHRMHTAVRTINKYRTELGIPNAYERAVSYKEKQKT